MNRVGGAGPNSVGGYQGSRGPGILQELGSNQGNMVSAPLSGRQQIPGRPRSKPHLAPMPSENAAGNFVGRRQMSRGPKPNAAPGLGIEANSISLSQNQPFNLRGARPTKLSKEEMAKIQQAYGSASNGDLNELGVKNSINLSDKMPPKDTDQGSNHLNFAPRPSDLSRNSDLEKKRESHAN